MGFKTKFYPESKFGGFSDVDGTIAFYTRVNAMIAPESIVIDYGCGRGAYGEDPIPIRRSLRILKGKACRVIGLDVDPAGANNPFIDEFHQLESPTWPVADASADLVICDNVLEHLVDPEGFFCQASRVLRPDGILSIRTPNAWSYVAIASRLVPNRDHVRVLARVKDRVQEQDVFPTVYRCNTVPAIRKMLARHNFEHVVYGYESEPSYLSFSILAYALGVIHQRLAPRLFKPAIFAFARKRA